MKILTENTAFQNIGKTLSKKCNGENQPRDFLQFCIEFLFSENTLIAGTVPESIKQGSCEIIDLLENKYSMDKKCIGFEDILDDSENARNLVDNITAVLSTEFNDIKYFDKLKLQSSRIDVSAILPRLDNETRELLINAASAANNKGEYEKFVQENLKYCKFSRDSGYFKIINSKREIIDRITDFGANNGWTIELAYLFMSKIRIYTNRALSNLTKYDFLSSVDRGQIDYNNRLKFLKIFDGIIKEGEKKLRGELNFGEINMPSMKEYIIEKGLGQPEGIMKEVVELRNNPMFVNLRKHINDMKKNYNQDSLDALNDIARETFNKLGNTNTKDSKIILERHLTTGVESYSIDNPDLVFAKDNPLNICTQSFSEVIRDMRKKYIGLYEKEFINNCMKKC